MRSLYSAVKDRRLALATTSGSDRGGAGGSGATGGSKPIRLIDLRRRLGQAAQAGDQSSLSITTEALTLACVPPANVWRVLAAAEV
jgi:hypothetical protein